ncbi:unnamed protein product [Caretta caretta]
MLFVRDPSPHTFHVLFVLIDKLGLEFLELQKPSCFIHCPVAPAQQKEGDVPWNGAKLIRGNAFLPHTQSACGTHCHKIWLPASGFHVPLITPWPQHPAEDSVPIWTALRLFHTSLWEQSSRRNGSLLPSQALEPCGREWGHPWQ